MARDGSVDDLVETLLRWEVDEVSSAEVVDDASRAVADADVAEWVVALACLLSDASANDIEDVLERVAPDIGFPVVPKGNPEAGLAAAFVMIRRCAAGHVTERDLARWMHTVIGHDRSQRLERLVVLDDVSDTVEYTSDTIGAVDAQVRGEVDRLARLYPHV